MNSDSYVRLSDRSVSELRSTARELRGLAVTASTTDARTALLRLADRFAALAQQRVTSISADQNAGSQ